MQGNMLLKHSKNFVFPEFVTPHISNVFFLESYFMKNCSKKASINCLCPDYSTRSLISSNFLSSTSSSRYSESNSASSFYFRLDSVSIIQSVRALSNIY